MDWQADALALLWGCYDNGHVLFQCFKPAALAGLLLVCHNVLLRLW